ncbi:PREDICTED: glutathione S-transferase omega-1-like [Cyphomyrmex costatus]|uniref:Glutathione-dependent dehydroascorbate reductase n=1 Tax=Cyphomyrmex costatus TaxID=456900 RepID=A0A195CML3_9HYME|nr:PREDICTED: glutathione S-transferase omega-1-like [Cyphomyrmex costatus]KYN01309.1 Glutathione S-transferase omega-1 [Cyphomyrmex costatus]
MNFLHLANGSEKPAEVKGRARLYGMLYCPYVLRVHHVLNFKQIPYDIININLQNKPQWFLQINPVGKVPVYIDSDGAIVTESVTVANYLDEKYPEPPLYNDETKSRDLELIDHFSKFVSMITNIIFEENKRPFEEILTEVMNILQKYEDELDVRKTTLFGGSNPGMLDILMWPWFDIGKALVLLHKQHANVERYKKRFPNIMKWADGMKIQPFVLKYRCSYKKLAKFLEAVKTKTVDYDNINDI